jgi:phospholipid N-methyltransferase
VSLAFFQGSGSSSLRFPFDPIETRNCKGKQREKKCETVQSSLAILWLPLTNKIDLVKNITKQLKQNKITSQMHAWIYTRISENKEQLYCNSESINTKNNSSLQRRKRRKLICKLMI